MRVIVLGAGVIGMTTAYYLSQQDCEVTVVDRCSDVAQETSFANGGQLSYSFTDALARPAFLSQIPRLLLGRDRGSHVRLSAGLIDWGTRFLAQCTSSRARENTLSILESALHSAELMHEMQETVPFDFSFRKAGKLVLLESDSEIRQAQDSVSLKQPHGCDARIISAEEAVSIEPALIEFCDKPLAAIWSPSDEVADPRAFARGMKNWLEQEMNVRFLLGQTVDALGPGSVVKTAEGDLSADAVVVCAGAWSDKLLKPLGIKSHIFPVRGYSVTLPRGAASPLVSVTSQKNRFVFSALNGHIRIAGFADFHGFHNDLDSHRIAELKQTAEQVAPLAADYEADDPHPWSGIRPMTPSGRPRIGATHQRGLYTNVGHGMLGWTLACDSGYKAAQAVIGNRS